MAPKVVMLVRHGEKPANSGKPYGVNVHGQSDGHALSVHGWIRAGGLAGIFANGPHPQYPGVVTPTRIHATNPSKHGASSREVNTAHPTATRLNIEIETDFSHGEEAKLAKTILAQDEDTLVVWHHGMLPAIVAGFPVRNAADVPSVWPPDRFDLIWLLTRVDDAPTYEFSEVSQLLLAGDNPK
jgi:hypothetical protein